MQPCNKAGYRYGMLQILGCVGQDQYHNKRYLCLCDCGKTVERNNNSLLRANIPNCGCISRQLKRKQPGESALTDLLQTYRTNAQRRGLSFDLTREQFKEIAQRACWYCFSPPSQRRKTKNGQDDPGWVTISDFVYSGVDRKDSDLGYTLDNCVPCCKICNRAKQDMPYEEFMAWPPLLACREKYKKLNNE